MEELESLSEKDNLSNVGISISEKDNTSEQWATIPCQAVQAGPSIGVETNDCLSPNGFHVLQDIREDGEIDDDEENNEDEVKQSTDEVVGNDFVADLTYTTSVVSQRQCSSQRSRSRGTKKTIVNSRALVQGISQQQKDQNITKKLPLRSTDVINLCVEHAWGQSATQTKGGQVLGSGCKIFYWLFVGN